MDSEATVDLLGRQIQFVAEHTLLRTTDRMIRAPSILSPSGGDFPNNLWTKKLKTRTLTVHRPRAPRNLRYERMRMLDSVMKWTNPVQ